eukprot:TRINITY_DN15799_c0_g1_i1.p1 TRINITY_DN15799_c0_g1~~TRINITY_DN15799_c0_g1_i1.p1  ORF type:complete len:138 (-),score=15.04 TRINITY_DN15799_c0_g1_i1:144-557(-)
MPQNLRIYPEDAMQTGKSCSTSCSSLPNIKGGSEPGKLAQRRIHNLGIVRSGTMSSQGKGPEVEYAQLAPLNDSHSSRRRDRNGEYIDKKSKRHHITFRDEVTGGKVADVNEVFSYKKHNCQSDDDDDIEKCSCTVF